MITPDYLGPIFGLSELAISLHKRAGTGMHNADKGSLRLLWAVIAISLFAGILAAKKAHAFEMSEGTMMGPIGVVLFFSGLALRWASIHHLGRFFTVNVAIADDHLVIDTGPYRYIRHPSYTGALLAFVGFGLCLGNWLGFLLILLPVTAAFLYRIRVEEAALVAGLGNPYEDYCQRTKRLLPLLY
jgi:protein-S-isoprenylcysteine O-methyltransferase